MEQVAADANPPVAQPKSIGVASSGAEYALSDDLLAGRFFSIDVKGQVTGWNPRAEAAFGWSTHHVSGVSLFEKLLTSGLGFGPDDLDEFFAAAAGGAGRRVRVLVSHMNGAQLPVELSIVPIQLAKAYELNAFLQDVSTSTASGVASEIGRVRDEHSGVLNMIAASLDQEPGSAPDGEGRLAGALIVFHIDATAMTMAPPPAGGAASDVGPTAAAAPPVAAEDPEIARAEAERVRAQIDEALAAAEEARGEAEAARRERDALQAQLDDAAASAGGEMEAAQRAAESARAEAEELRTRAAEVESNAATAREAAEEARREAERLRGELEGLRTAADGTQASAEQTAADLGQARAELSQAQSESAKLGEQLASVESELTAAREERDALRAEVEQLRLQVEAAGETDAALTAARSQVESLEAEVAAARAEVEAAAQRAEEVAADAAAAREGGQAAEAAVAAAREEAHSAQAELADARSRVEALEGELASARADAEAAVAERETARDEALASHEAAKAARAEAGAAQAETEAARSETETARAEAEAARAESETARAEAETARAEAETARAEAEAARAEAGAAQTASEEAQAQTEQAQSELETARTELAAATERSTAAEAALETARAELKTAHEETAAIRAELDAVRAEAESAGKTVGDAQAELGEARADAVKARAEADKAAGEAEEARAAAEQAQADAEAARAEAETARAEAEEARAAAEAAEAAAVEPEPTTDPVFEAIFDGAAIGMAIKADGRFVRVNRALCELTGRNNGDLLAVDPVELVHPDEREAHAATEASLLSGDAASSHAEARLVHATGEEVTVRESASVLDDGTLLLQFEVTEADAHTAVEDHDPVTGLFNRRRFEEELSRHVAEAAKHGDRGAALMLDLDANTSELDEAQGEQLLKTVAESLKQTMGEAEMLAHLGGDEFAVLLPHADATQARKIAEHIVEAVGPQVVTIGDQSVRVTIDVGVALFDEREDHVAQAAAATATAEPPAGDNLPVPAAQSGPSTALAPADSIVDRIRQALAEDTFLLYAQPIIDLRTSEVTQYELLIRMKDESGRLMLPDKFLPAAQQAGLMPAIDQWVVRRAIGLIHDAAQDGRRLLLEVNVSSDSIDDPALQELIEAELDATGIDPRMLVIEVTEDAALAKIDETIKLSKWIRSTGCRFALDDFGSTFATVKYLKDMPVDYFKLDGDLIVTLPESRTNQLLLNALMDVARGTGTQTIAVYVPDDETLVMLRQFGIGYGQGNRVGRPRPVAEI